MRKGRVLLPAPEFRYVGGVEFPNPVLDLINQLSHEPRPPPVVSISYGAPEGAGGAADLAQFDIEAKVLSLQGVSLFAAAGELHHASAVT